MGSYHLPGSHCGKSVLQSSRDEVSCIWSVQRLNFELIESSAGVFTRGGVMFFMLLFNALLALAELTAAFESRPILMKHKSL